MATDVPAEAIAAAEGYHELLVPALMAEWAPRVADAAAIRPGDRVLDVACGTGVLAGAAASRVGPTGTVTGLDLSPGMLAVAARRLPVLIWREGTAQALPFSDASFDVVVSQFGMMFFPDPAAALREMMRVLAPGGRLAVAVWASLADTPAYAAESDLVERFAGATAGQMLRAPFALGDPARLRALCEEAGIAGARIVQQSGRGRFPSVTVMLEADLLGWLPVLGIDLAPSVVAEILRQAETELAPFLVREPDGRISFDSPALIISAQR